MEINIVQPLYQQVYREFKKLILTGQIPPGEKIVMSKLAEQYKISRTPLREALRQLQNEGLITQDHSIMKVVELNKNDFLELCHCRLVLEKEVVRLMVNEITKDALEKVYEVLMKSKQAIEDGDSFKVLELNAQFHELLIINCSNQHLVQLLDHTRSLLLIYRAKINKKPQYNLEIFQEHLKLFEAIKSRDIDQSVLEVESHLLNDQKRGLDFFQ
ncbi:GntR family transcriptional regulator [Metabacillus herbersteinensis]|uniref:GntR family transcriptional regulator n=1 Tax=Metabacillus herbersteinensis TaxID=283816 RepID=A0ABV6GL44_9BACI